VPRNLSVLLVSPAHDFSATGLIAQNRNFVILRHHPLAGSSLFVTLAKMDFRILISHQISSPDISVALFCQ